MAVQTTSTTPTGWAADAAYANWQQAQGAINRPYTAYPGNMLAGFNPDQNAAIAGVRGGAGYGLDALMGGQAAAQQAAGYQPQQVAGYGYAPTMMGAANAGYAQQADAASAGPAAQLARSSVRDVTAGKFTDADINAYMNPYTNTVVNNALSDLTRQNDITNNATNARAAAAGAFGGSRQSVANSLNNEAYLRESGNLSGNLRNQAFNTASGLIGQDNDRTLQAQGMNQTADYNVGALNTNALNNMAQYNASNVQQANLTNMQARNQQQQYNTSNLQEAYRNNAAIANTAGSYNSDINLRSQLANQAAGQNAANLWVSAGNALNGMGLDQQRFNLNNANALWGMGQSQQAQEQAGLNNAYQQWQDQYNYPLTQANQLRAALQGAPIGSSQSSPYYNNTAANVLAGGLGAAQLASYLPSAIGGVKAGYDALSGLLPSAAPSTAFDIMDPSAFW